MQNFTVADDAKVVRRKAARSEKEFSAEVTDLAIGHREQQFAKKIVLHSVNLPLQSSGVHGILDMT